MLILPRKNGKTRLWQLLKCRKTRSIVPPSKRPDPLPRPVGSVAVTIKPGIVDFHSMSDAEIKAYFETWEEKTRVEVIEKFFGICQAVMDGEK